MPAPDLQFSDQRLADLYDLGNAGSDDRDYYLSPAGEAPQDILDLGCGTGLLSLAYAAKGHRVVAVDPAPAMLTVAKRAPLRERVHWIESTSEAFVTDQTFDLIVMTGHAFQVLLTNAQVEATLANMARHLKPGSLVAFESRNPTLDWDYIWGRSYDMETPHGSVRAVRRMIDTSLAPEFLSFAWDYQLPDGVLTSDSTLRFLAADAIIEFADKAGLKAETVLGDWQGGAFDPDLSREMIFKLRRKGAE
ncbi:MAG: class I SAM-dependent methyltransferase [Henriciella sp.]|nr:class I SAM-dependent methyltransferase [Henriciella sp.]